MQTFLVGTLTRGRDGTNVVVHASPPPWVTSVVFAVILGGMLAIVNVLLGIGAALASAGIFVPLDHRNRAAVLREFEQLLLSAVAGGDTGTARPVTVACERCGEPLPLGATECPMCGHEWQGAVG